jgi:hypothetical protein
MQDLTGQGPAALAPSSQEAGNITQPDLARWTMTAPGSVPVTPMPAPEESAQMPQPQPGAVYDPPNRVHGAAQAGQAGSWADVNRPAGSGWAET